jgi:hypothetical protein
MDNNYYAPGLVSVDDYAQTATPGNTLAQIQPPQPQQPQAPQHSGNFLTHLLPTGGALAGGAGGAALGSAILPGVGTILGGILGATLGGGTAKAAENSAEGKSIGNDVGQTAVESGVGQALGGVAGKVLGKGAQFLTGHAEGITNAAKDASEVEKAGKAALANTQKMNAIYGGSKGNVGEATKIADIAGLDMENPETLKNAGQQLIDNTGATLNDTVGTTAIPISGVVDASGKKMAPSIDDLIHSSLTNTHELTGDRLGASRATIMGGFGPDQTDEDLLRNGYTRFLSASAKNGTNTDATGFLKEANQILSGVNHGSHASASDLLDAQRMVGDRAYAASKAAAKPSATDVTQAKAEAWNDLNNKLQNMIYSHPDVEAAAKNMVGTTPASEFGGNQALADLFNSRVTNMKSGDDLNTLFKDAYNLRNVGSDGLDVVSNPASTGNLKLAKMDINGDGIPDAQQTPSALEAGHKIVTGGGGPLAMATRAVVHGANNPSFLNTLSRFSKIGSKLATPAAVTAATANNLGADPIATNQTQGDTMNATMQGQSPLDQLYSTLLANYQAGGGITANDGNLAGTLATLAPQVQKNNMVAHELSGLVPAYDNAGGSQGMGGILSRISAFVPGTAAHTYQAQQAGAAQALAAQLGISPQAAAGLLPQLMQNQQTAGMNTGILGQLQGQLAY